MDWDEAWDITSHSVAYTNHTVLSEALERWPQQLVETLLPRVWQIIQEIARRWQEKVENFFHDPCSHRKDGYCLGRRGAHGQPVRCGGLSVNGVSGLHSEILKKDVFQDAYAMAALRSSPTSPTASTTAAGSVQINPGLDALIRDLHRRGRLPAPPAGR